jgi:hypothetical protein
LTGPQHPPYGLFCPAPGHSLGFNDLKVNRGANLLRAIVGQESAFLAFEDGLTIEKVIHGFSRSVKAGKADFIQFWTAREILGNGSI